jgi:hypothetical protein
VSKPENLAIRFKADLEHRVAVQRQSNRNHKKVVCLVPASLTFQAALLQGPTHYQSFFLKTEPFDPGTCDGGCWGQHWWVE